MARLSVRQLDDFVYEKLRIQASEHGISMEEEVRQILAKAVSAPVQITDVFYKHFGPKNGVDLVLPKRTKSHKPLDFTE